MEAAEGRKVATVDIPGAFMQADMDELVYVKFQGEMADALTRIDPERYAKFVVQEKGKSVVYAALSKVLYGTIRGSLLFWQRLTAKLTEWEFEVNPYDWCVVNKVVWSPISLPSPYKALNFYVSETRFSTSKVLNTI